VTGPSADDFLQRVREAVRLEEPKRFPDIFAEYLSFTGRTEAGDGVLAEPGVFEQLVALMRQDQFLRMARSSELMSIWEYEWGTLSEAQRARLLELLREVVPRVSDDMSAFVASELLGQFYGYEESVPVILDLSRSPSEVARLYMPHAAIHLLERTPEGDDRARLIQCIEDLRGDASSAVREEAGAAVRALPAVLAKADLKSDSDDT
jgi:hypothetical protein